MDVDVPERGRSLRGCFQENRITALVRTLGAPRKPIEKRRTKSRRRTDRPLNPAQEMFIARYLVRMNATRAYQDSYPKASYATARCEGSKLLVDPRIAKQIRASLADTKARLAQDADHTLHQLAAIGFSSLSDVYTSAGTLIKPNDLPRDVATAVRRLERREIVAGQNEDGTPRVVGYKVTVEMHDKIQALRLLGQHYGLFVD